MMRLQHLIVTVVLFVGGTTAAVSIGRPSPTWQTFTEQLPIVGAHLDQWLPNLTVTIPPLNVSGDGLLFHIGSLTCSDLDFTALDTTTPKPLQIDYAVTGMTLQCGGAIRVYNESTAAFAFDATVGVRVNPETSVRVGMSFTRNDTLGLATAVRAVDVSTDIVIHASDVAFNSSSPEINKLEKQLLPVILALVHRELDKAITTAFTDLIDKGLNSTIVRLDEAVLPYLHPEPPSYEPAPPGAINLAESPLFYALGQIFEHLAGTGNFTINDLIDRLTNGTGAIHADHLDIKLATSIANLSDVAVTVKAIDIGGLDKWSELVLFEPVDNATLRTKIALGRLDVNVTLAVSVNMTGDIITDAYALEDEITARLQVTNATVDLFTFLALNKATIWSFNAQDLFASGCFASAIMDCNVTFATMAVDIATLELESSGRLESEIFAAVQDLVDLLLHEFPAGINAGATAVFNARVIPMLNQEIQEALANVTCHRAVEEIPLEMWWVYLSLPVAAVVTVLVGIILEVYRCRHRRYVESNGFGSAAAYKALLVNSDERRGSSIDGATMASDAQSHHQQQWTLCLALEPSVSTFTRHFMTFFVLGVIAMFASTSAWKAAELFPAIDVGEDQFFFFPISYFALHSSVRQMWNAGVYPLAIITVFFSGAWPYIKLVLMFVCWVVPTSLLSVRARERLLQFLDAYGKYSLIDSFMMTLLLVAFRFELGYRDEDNPQHNLLFHMYVKPLLGFNLFMYATILSLVVSHVMLYVHRSAEKQHARLRLAPGTQALCRHSFTIGSTTYKFTTFGASAILASILGMIVLMCVGASIQAFSFKFEGLVALLMDETGEETLRPFSLISLAYQLPSSSPEPNAFAMRAIQALEYVFAFVVPVLHMIVTAIVWAVPMSSKWLERAFITAEILYAWAAMDVFVIGVLASVLEIRQYVQYIIGDSCKPINNFLKKHFDKQLHHVDKCFDVQTTLDEGIWSMVAAAVMCFLYSALVMRICEYVLRQRLESVDEGYYNAGEAPLPDAEEKKPLLGTAALSGTSNDRGSLQADGRSSRSCLGRCWARLDMKGALCKLGLLLGVIHDIGRVNHSMAEIESPSGVVKKTSTKSDADVPRSLVFE